jgi:hypothetical protein
MYPSSSQALLKDIYVFWSLPLPSLPSGNGKSIWMSLREKSLKKIAANSGFVTEFTFFYWAIEISSIGDETVLVHCLNPGLPLTCQVFIPLSPCHPPIASLHGFISFKPLHADLIILACLIRVRKFLRMFHLGSDKGPFLCCPVGDTSWETEGCTLAVVSRLAWSKCRNNGGSLPAARSECFCLEQLCLIWGQCFYVFSPGTLGTAVFLPLEIVWMILSIKA